jgi:SPP1 gp7 family putative phage head morphogenesis protein
LFDDRNVSPDNQKKLLQYYYNTLAKGVDLGYNPKPEMYDPKLAHSLKYDVAKFSAFKETSFRKQLESALTKDGKILPWSEFKKTADALNIDYNRRWLKTEYNHTVATANMAEQWQDFEAEKDLYPNLKYVTAGDARVRDAHKILDGVVLPVDHPFWKTHTTPLDWGCRCFVEQTDEAASKVIPSYKVKEAFQNNAFYSGKVFNQSAYEAGLSEAEGKEAKENLNGFLQTEKNLINTKNPKVQISLGADLQDLKRNYEVANICAKETNIDFIIRTHNMTIGIKNPEYLIYKKYLGDRKSIKSLNGMLKGIDEAKKQMMQLALNPNQIHHYIVWDLDLIKKLDVDLMIKNILKKVSKDRGRTIKGMIFQYKGKVVHLSREQIVNLDFGSFDVFK